MSSAPNSTPGKSGPDSDTVTVGVGGQTSGQQGATPIHETQEETGGNGGPGLTRNQSGPYVNAPDGAEQTTPDAQAAPRTESVDAAMTHANPGAQDTRASQAGRHETGLGAAETGGNQDEDDLPPARP